MPRPAHGYVNAAGAQVPGVHDITNAYCPKPALVNWAYGRGKAGLPLYEEATLDIGTAVHTMAELDLRGKSLRDIDARLYQILHHGDEILKARAAYRAFCDWRDRVHLQAIAHEATIVSETWQLGGTPDCIAYIDGKMGLLDFKTCTKAPRAPYPEQLLVMAAHAQLWNEANPDRPVEACHIIYLPKDGAPHAHHMTNRMAPLWGEFAWLLRAYAAKHGTPAPRDPHDPEIARLAATEAGKTLRAFAGPPPLPRTRPKQTQLTLDIAPGTLFAAPAANVVKLHEGIPEFLKRPAAPSVKPRVRMRTDGSWFYVKR